MQVGLLELIYGALAHNPRRLTRPADKRTPDLLIAHYGGHDGYRVMIRIDEDAHTIEIVSIGPRRSVYRP